MRTSSKLKIIIAFAFLSAIIVNFTFQRQVIGKCGNKIWDIGEDINNCPQDANKYSVSPPGEINVLDTGNYTIGMYIFPDWHNSQYRSADFIDWKWQPIKDSKQFTEGQEQPKKPIFNYYDDSNPVAVDWMIKWALEHGINLFIYDWYDDPHNEIPIDIMLDRFNTKYVPYKNKAGFMLLWANHKKYDSVNDVLLSFNNALKYFKQPQYFKADQKPVFGIFDIGEFIKSFGADATNGLLKEMKNKAKQEGLGGLYILLINECSFNPNDFLAFDAVSAYSYSNYAKMPTDSYDNYIKIYENMWNKVYDKCRLLNNLDGQPIDYWLPVSTSWDNFPWKGRYDFPMYISAILNGTPEKFKTMLQKAKQFTKKNNINPKIIVINSWDEWGEGSVLSPREDKWKFEYLKSVKDVFNNTAP